MIQYFLSEFKIKEISTKFYRNWGKSVKNGGNLAKILGYKDVPNGDKNFEFVCGCDRFLAGREASQLYK